MDKKEKYYKFIIDNLLKKTEIDSNAFGGTSVVVPYSPEDEHYVHDIIRMSEYEVYIGDFSYYVNAMYGANVDEMVMLYRLYLDGVVEKAYKK